VNPDVVTWLSLITVCSHAGLVEYGTDVFEAVDGVRTIELHNGLIDMLARAGQIEGAMSVVAEQMPFPPNAVTWNTLLGACQKPTGGYRILTELGSVAFECAAAFDLQQHAPYISMFHMYADAQMWEEARRVECLRTMCAG
jgi:pentatricopeptide repeat protein